MTADEIRKFLAKRGRKLEAASRTLENQMGAIEREIQQRKHLTRELDELISKYWPDEPDGRPATWKGQDGYDLVVLVEGMQKEFDLSIKDAIADLHKIKCPSCHQHPVKQLVVRYQEAKKHWWPAIKRIREIEAEWDALDAAAKARKPAMTFDELRDLVYPGRKKLNSR